MILLPYQQRWVNDTSPRRIANKSRRIGFSFAETLRRSIRAVACRKSQYLISASERQSKGLLETCRKHIEGMELATGHKLIATWSATRGVLKNGATLNALSANPRSIRGDGGDVLLDEFAFHQRSEGIWAAAKALTDPHIGNPQGYELAIISTPFGDGDDNKFYTLFRDAEKNGFSRHQVDIHQAVAEGFTANVERFRQEAGTEEMFAQEYECSFLSASMRYISASLWDSMVCGPDALPAPSGIPPRFAGMDVGRKHDASVIVEAERRGDILWQMLPAEYRRKESWDDQEAWADDVMGRCDQMAVDATGIGNQFAERLANRWISRIEGVEFTQKSKEQLATGLKLALERGRLRPLADDVDLRRDVLNLRRDVTDFGNVRFDAPRTKAGHADGAWALALMVHAAGGAVRERNAIPEAYAAGRMRTRSIPM